MDIKLTGLQEMQVSYQYFTLEEWRLLARCVHHAQGDLQGTAAALDEQKVSDLLGKFPSAVL